MSLLKIFLLLLPLYTSAETENPSPEKTDKPRNIELSDLGAKRVKQNIAIIDSNIKQVSTNLEIAQQNLDTIEKQEQALLDLKTKHKELQKKYDRYTQTTSQEMKARSTHGVSDPKLLEENEKWILDAKAKSNRIKELGAQAQKNIYGIDEEIRDMQKGKKQWQEKLKYYQTIIADQENKKRDYLKLLK